MQRAGAQREQLSEHLTVAYGRGLISANTFAGRLDELFGQPVVDPERIVGDLYLRGRQTSQGLRRRLSDTINSTLDQLRHHSGERSFLGLDWSGHHPDLLIGRGLHCDIRLTDPTVSRNHARLRFRDGAWSVQDLESSNGTTLNGRRIGRCELRPGDRLGLGDLSLTVD